MNTIKVKYSENYAAKFLLGCFPSPLTLLDTNHNQGITCFSITINNYGLHHNRSVLQQVKK